MKKQILLLFSIVISTLTFSQAKQTFGVRGGLTYSSMEGAAVNNFNGMLNLSQGMITTNNRTSFFVGVYTTFPVDDVISVEPALYYAEKGYELRGNLNIKGLGFLGANAKAQLNAQYIDIPVLIKANLSGLQLLLGPQVSYLMKADLNTTVGVLGINLLNNKIDATRQFNRWDMALTAGVGYQFTSGINIMASYDYGLSKVDANKSMNSYNRSLKVGIGMSF